MAAAIQATSSNQPEAREGGHQTDVRAQARTHCLDTQGNPRNRARRTASAARRARRCWSDTLLRPRRERSVLRVARLESPAQHVRSMRDRRRGRQARPRTVLIRPMQDLATRPGTRRAPATARIHPNGEAGRRLRAAMPVTMRAHPAASPATVAYGEVPGDREGRATPSEPDGCAGNGETRQQDGPSRPPGNRHRCVDHSFDRPTPASRFDRDSPRTMSCSSWDSSNASSPATIDGLRVRISQRRTFKNDP